MDPSDTARVPDYGGPEAQQPSDDPCSILGRLLSVARSDSVYWDLERLRKTNNRLDILKELSPLVFEQKDLCRLLGGLHSRVAANSFNHEVRALWLMIPGSAAGLDRLRRLWEKIDSIPRYTLRSRAEEYLRLARDLGRITPETFAKLHLSLDQPRPWNGYYRAVRAIEDLAPHFRNLRFRVWRELYRPSNGRRPMQTLPRELTDAIESRLQELLECSLRLQKERTALAKAFFKVVRNLAPESEERGIAEAFQRFGPEDQGPYGNDSQKPQQLLLRPEDMELSILAPARSCLYLRRIIRSLRGLFKRNRERFPYSILTKAGGVLAFIQGLVWLFETTVFYRPRTRPGSYFYVLLLGLVLGLILGIVLV